MDPPTRIPVNGPPGTNGRIDVIAPTNAPLPVAGKYLVIILDIFLENNPPSLEVLPSSSTISLPKSNSLNFLLFFVRDIEAPTAAPNNGPPIIPVISDTPAPITPPAAASGANFFISPHAEPSISSCSFCACFLSSGTNPFI